MTEEGYRALERHLWPAGEEGCTWGIFDGAKDRKIYWRLLNSNFEYSCLYAGDLPIELERNAPHLVRLDAGDPGAMDLVREAWGQHWGIFVQFRGAMFDLRVHFRRFLTVQDWTGRKLLFRYYDPRVLRAYLPTCNAAELQTVYGPVRTFWTEDRTGCALLQFRTRAGQLVPETVPLA